MNRDTFTLPLNADDYDKWVKYAKDLEPQHIIQGVTIILLCLRILFELTFAFPAFGILFATLGRAKFELMNFFIVFFLPSE